MFGSCSQGLRCEPGPSLLLLGLGLQLFLETWIRGRAWSYCDLLQIWENVGGVIPIGPWVGPPGLWSNDLAGAAAPLPYGRNRPVGGCAAVCGIGMAKRPALLDCPCAPMSHGVVIS